MAARLIGKTLQGAVIYYGSAAERDAMADIVDAGARQFRLPDGSRYESDGEGGWDITHGAGGVVLVANTGITGEAYTFRLPAAVTAYARATNGAELQVVGGFREWEVMFLPTVAFTNEKKALVTFGAPSEGVANSWLSDTGGQSFPVMNVPIRLGVWEGPFFSDTPINWADVDPDVDGQFIIRGVV
jgi:hypothetical protein